MSSSRINTVTLFLQLVMFVVCYAATETVSILPVVGFTMVWALLVGAITRDGVLFMVVIAAFFASGAILIAEISVVAAWVGVLAVVVTSYYTALGIAADKGESETFRWQYFLEVLPIVGPTRNFLCTVQKY